MRQFHFYLWSDLFHERHIAYFSKYLYILSFCWGIHYRGTMLISSDRNWQPSWCKGYISSVKVTFSAHVLFEDNYSIKTSFPCESISEGGIYFIFRIQFALLFSKGDNCFVKKIFIKGRELLYLGDNYSVKLHKHFSRGSVFSQNIFSAWAIFRQGIYQS